MGDLHRLTAIDRNFPDVKSFQAKHCIDDPLTIGRDGWDKSSRVSQQLSVTAIDVHSPYLRRTRAKRSENNIAAIGGCRSSLFPIDIISKLLLVAPIGIHDPEIRITAG